MDYKLRKAEPRDVSDILRLVKVDVMLFGPVWIRRYGSHRSVAWREFATSGDDRSRVSSRLRSRLSGIRPTDFRVWGRAGCFQIWSISGFAYVTLTCAVCCAALDAKFASQLSVYSAGTC